MELRWENLDRCLQRAREYDGIRTKGCFPMGLLRWGAASGCTTWRYRGAHSRLLLFVQPCGRASMPFHFPFMYAHLPNAAFFLQTIGKVKPV